MNSPVAYALNLPQGAYRETGSISLTVLELTQKLERLHDEVSTKTS